MQKITERAAAAEDAIGCERAVWKYGKTAPEWL